MESQRRFTGWFRNLDSRGRIQDLSTASDIFSLGAILYELLTGRPPFHRATAIETLRAVVETEAKRPRLANPAIDPDIETICLKCLEKDPARRYAPKRRLRFHQFALRQHLMKSPLFRSLFLDPFSCSNRGRV